MKSGACALICVCFLVYAFLFLDDMHNAVTTVAASSCVFIYIRKSLGVFMKLFHSEQMHQAIARK